MQRQNIEEEVLYPDGETETISRSIFSSFSFRIWSAGDRAFIVKIINPPVSLKNFVGALSDLISDISIEKVVFDTIETYRSITSSAGVSRFSVPRVLAAQIPFSPNSVASIDLKAESDALKKLESKYDLSQVRVTKLYLDIRFDGQNEKLTISSAGSVSLSKGLSETMDEYVKAAVLKPNL